MNNIPYGYCHCGCGGKTTIRRQTSIRWGWIKGEPAKYISGHNPPWNKGINGGLCPMCKENLKDDRSGYCRECRNKKLNLNYYAKGRDKYHKEYRMKHREALLKKQKERYVKNKDQWIANSIRNRQKQIALLTDSYIKNVIVARNDIDRGQITGAMVRLVRSYIKLRRMVRKINPKGAQYVECDGNSGSLVGTNHGAGNGSDHLKQGQCHGQRGGKDRGGP